MICCGTGTRETLFKFYEIEEDYYTHWENYLKQLLKETDCLELINEILFNSKDSTINKMIFKDILDKRCKIFCNELFHILLSSFYIMPERVNECNQKTTVQSYENYSNFNIKILIQSHFHVDIDKFHPDTSSYMYNYSELGVTCFNVDYLIFFFLTFSSIPNTEKSEIFFDLLDQSISNYIQCDNPFRSIFAKYVQQCIFLPDIVSDYMLQNNYGILGKYIEKIEKYKQLLLFIKSFESINQDFILYVAFTLIFYNPITNQRIYRKEVPFLKESRKSSNIFYKVLKDTSFKLFEPRHIRQCLDDFILKIGKFKHFQHKLEYTIKASYCDIANLNIMLYVEDRFKKHFNKELYDEMDYLEKLIANHKIFNNLIEEKCLLKNSIEVDSKTKRKTSRLASTKNATTSKDNKEMFQKNSSKFIGTERTFSKQRSNNQEKNMSMEDYLKKEYYSPISSEESSISQRDCDTERTLSKKESILGQSNSDISQFVLTGNKNKHFRNSLFHTPTSQTKKFSLDISFNDIGLKENEEVEAKFVDPKTDRLNQLDKRNTVSELPKSIFLFKAKNKTAAVSSRFTNKKKSLNQRLSETRLETLVMKEFSKELKSHLNFPNKNEKD